MEAGWRTWRGSLGSSVGIGRSPWRTGRRGGRGVVRGGREGGGRGEVGESGDGVRYLKVVGIISSAAGDQLARQVFPRRLPVPRGFFTWRPLPRDLAKKEHASACRPCVVSHAHKRGLFEHFTQISRIPEVKLAGRQKRPKSLTARATASDGECSRTDADARSGYQMPSKNGWSRPGKIILSRRLRPYRLGPLA